MPEDNHSIVCKSVTCSDTDCSMNCYGYCFNSNVLLDKLTINMPDPDSCYNRVEV